MAFQDDVDAVRKALFTSDDELTSQLVEAATSALDRIAKSRELNVSVSASLPTEQQTADTRERLREALEKAWDDGFELGASDEQFAHRVDAHARGRGQNPYRSS